MRTASARSCLANAGEADWDLMRRAMMKLPEDQQPSIHWLLTRIITNSARLGIESQGFAHVGNPIAYNICFGNAPLRNIFVINSNCLSFLISRKMK